MDDPTDNLRVQDEAQPTVTIGLPVYNGEKFLAETIESLLAQTFDDFELIISDNASTDATEKICRARAKRDRRIRYVRQPRNIGSYNNFNFLVGQARGRYFKWAAADDLIAPTFLARCVEILADKPAYVLCHSNTITIGKDGQELPNDIIRSSGACENDAKYVDREYPPSRRFRDVLLGSTAAMDLWGLIRTDALRESGLLAPCVGYEKVLMAELALKGRFWKLSERLSYYRIHPDQISSQSSANEQWRRFDPRIKNKSYPRLRYLRGYAKVVNKSDIPFSGRLHSFLAICRYLFQITKWKKVMLEIFLLRGFGEGNAVILQGVPRTKKMPRIN